MSKLTYLIYKHTSPTGKSYIGQTSNYNRRTSEHKRLLGKCPLFEAAIKKHGFDNFRTEILAENLTLDEANKLEEFYIQQFNTLTPNGYNLTTGGVNYIRSVEIRNKISKQLKGRSKPSRTQEHCNNISTSHKNKIRTKEHSLSLSRANKGKSKPPRTLEHCNNLKGPKIILTCPHCGKVGGGGSMIRWHFDNCKYITI